MIKKVVLKRNNSISTENTKEIILSIQFSLDGFSFCTTNSANKEVLFFKNYTFEKAVNSAEELLDQIKVFFENDADFQKLEFSKVNVIHQNNLSTLVPDKYFDENSLKEYLKYNIKILKNDFIAFDEISEINAYNVYIPYVNVNNYLFQNFGEFEYEHHISVLLKKLKTIHRNNDKVMYVNVSKNSLDIIILEGNAIILSNSFSFFSKEDFIYYILFVAEQNQMDPKEFYLYFLGDITKDSELYQMVYTYIKNVFFLESENTSYKNLQIPKHSNYTLLG